MSREFWMPENWPGGRAPARWIYRDRSEDRAAERRRVDRAVAEGKPAVCNASFMTDYLSVELWVPDVCVHPEGGALWWISGGHVGTAAECIRWWIREERKLTAERDEILDAREELLELQMTVPAVVIG